MLSIALLAGCSSPMQLPASAYRGYGDRLKTYLPILGTPCGNEWRQSRRIASERCFRLGGAQHFDGVMLRYGYSDPLFLAGATRADQVDFAATDSRLVSDRYTLRSWFPPDRAPAAPVNQASAFRIRFTGRATAANGPRVILIDRIDAIARLPFPGADPRNATDAPPRAPAS